MASAAMAPVMPHNTRRAAEGALPPTDRSHRGTSRQRARGNAMNTAMIETGELPAEEQPKQDNGISDANDKFISRISGLGFRNIIKNNSKIVIYKKGNNIIEPYKNSADWNTKFEFAEFVSTVPRSNRIFKKYCGEICIIDMQKKKYIAIPKDKLNDNNYLYEALVKFYN